jgi:hypothetical protein
MGIFILEYKDFIENKKNTTILYQDTNIKVTVVRDYQSAKKSAQGTDWCSSTEVGYYSHRHYTNMYRFYFSDGTKLRLTWAYDNEYGQNTHWGIGGVLTNGDKIEYRSYILREGEDVFTLDEIKADSFKQKHLNIKELIEYVSKIPVGAIEKVRVYQDKLLNYCVSVDRKIRQLVDNILVLSVDISDGYNYGVPKHKIVVDIGDSEYKIDGEYPQCVMDNMDIYSKLSRIVVKKTHNKSSNFVLKHRMKFIYKQILDKIENSVKSLNEQDKENLLSHYKLAF